jgi:hypothetical protein
LNPELKRKEGFVFFVFVFVLGTSSFQSREFEVDDEFYDGNIKALMENWNSPMWDWECKNDVSKV